MPAVRHVLYRDMEAYMPRTTISTIAIAFACICGGRTLGAQETTLPVDSSLQVRALPTVRVTAEKAKASRQGVLALMEENRRLAAELYRQDRKADSLARRLAYLKGPVTDSMTRDLARVDAQVLETRSRRQALEARLASLEGNSASLAP